MHFARAATRVCESLYIEDAVVLTVEQDRTVERGPA
jgi:hypothetical protein